MSADEMVAWLLGTFPWARQLPEDDQRQFVAELSAGSADDTQLVAEWRHTAEVWADPCLLQRLTAPISGDHGPVPPPMGEE